MSLKKTVKQTNHVYVIGVKRGSTECPSGTWQIKMGSGNPKDRPVCSNLDPEVCGPGTKSKWANLTRLDNGSVVSLDGMVECGENGEKGQEVVSYRDFVNKCFNASTDCPIDHSNANNDKKNKPMKICSTLTHIKNLPSTTKLTSDQELCITHAKQVPVDLAKAINFDCNPPRNGLSGIHGNDCMCANPEWMFVGENYPLPNNNAFWNVLTKDNPVLYKQRGTWMKACNSKSYLNSPLITTSGDVVKTCNNLDVFLGGQKEVGNLNDVTLSDFKDLSICYTGGKFNGGKGGGNDPLTPFSTIFDKYFWYIVAFIVVILVVLMIVAYAEKKKKTKKKKTTKTSKTNEKISSAKK